MSSKFSGVDKYYSPFIAPDSTGRFKLSHLRGLLPESNVGIKLIPQILANDPLAFLKVAEQVSELGYDEVNLNAGCPSGTVVSKRKGSGMLGDLDAYERFLDTIFDGVKIKVSIKTRMGLNSTAEFPALCELYNRYPISLLIIHPRVREQFYKGKPDTECFIKASELMHRKREIRGMLFKQLSYPVLLIIGIIAFLCVIATYIVPQLAALCPPETWKGAAAYLYAVSSFVYSEKGIIAGISIAALCVLISFSMPRWTGRAC